MLPGGEWLRLMVSVPLIRNGASMDGWKRQQVRVLDHPWILPVGQDPGDVGSQGAVPPRGAAPWTIPSMSCPNRTGVPDSEARYAKEQDSENDEHDQYDEIHPGILATVRDRVSVVAPSMHPPSGDA